MKSEKGKLPDFDTVSQSELREIWAQYPDPKIRRVILEVARYRQVITTISGLHEVIQSAWRRDVGGNLVALHVLKKLLWDENHRY